MQVYNKQKIMNEKYIVAVDGSSAGLKAVKEAEKNALNVDNVEIHLLHVLTEKVNNSNGDLVIEEATERSSEGESIIKKAKENINEDVMVETKIINGSPAESIIDYVDEVSADKLFVGHRKLDKHNGVKSVAKSLISNSPCPVTVVTNPLARNRNYR